MISKKDKRKLRNQERWERIGNWFERKICWYKSNKLIKEYSKYPGFGYTFYGRMCYFGVQYKEFTPVSYYSHLETLQQQLDECLQNELDKMKQ